VCSALTEGPSRLHQQASGNLQASHVLYGLMQGSGVVSLPGLYAASTAECGGRRAPVLVATACGATARARLRALWDSQGLCLRAVKVMPWVWLLPLSHFTSEHTWGTIQGG
jgi:hypothetical protein